jgi:hypothetical protein
MASLTKTFLTAIFAIFIFPPSLTAIAQNHETGSLKAAGIGILTLPESSRSHISESSSMHTEPSTTDPPKANQNSKSEAHFGTLIKTIGNALLRKTLQLPTFKY